MRAVKIVLILLLTALLINWMRGAGGPIARVLPFMGGHRPALFEVASVVMIVIALWGWARLGRRGRQGPKTREWPDSESLPEAEEDDGGT